MGRKPVYRDLPALARHRHSFVPTCESPAIQTLARFAPAYTVDLLRQSDATDENCKAWIVTEGFESTPSYEIGKLRVTFLISLFHPDESLIQVTQGPIENPD